jgi:hypothetical protein
MGLVIRIWQRIEPWFSDQMLREAQRRIRSVEEIQARWGVECDVVAEFDDEQVYRQVFYPRRNILSRRTGQSLRKELRSRSGNFFVNGTVVVFQDGEPFYYAPPHRAEFLKSFREKGPAWLRSVVEQNEATAGRRSRAEKLALKFCERAEQLGFHGHLRREYPLNLARLAGTSPAEDLGTSHTPFADLSAKSIDILHHHEGTYDVIEVKPRLNWEALGQALGYRELLCVIENLPQDKVRAHVICKQIDSAIALACRRLGVGIIQV